MALINIDGINYVLNTKTSSAEVWRLEKYDRDIIDIPPYISYGSVKYRVTEIASGAFKSLSNVRLIKIPDTVISIGYNAFEGTAWYGNLPNGIIYVNNVLYRYKGDMPANTNVVIPEGIISISPDAFQYCENLTSVVIPKTVTHIGMGAFSMCTSLKDVVIPDSVTSIDYAAFANTKWFNNMPDGLVYINNVLYTYKGSKKINPTIVINEGVVSITSHALSEPFGRLDSVSSDLISLTIPDSVTHIGDHAFSKCMKLTTVKLPSNISCIGYGTFEDCSSLTTINIPNGIESIGDSAFKNCKSLKVLEIPTSVVSIGDCAFDGCSALKSITIPNSVTKIGRGLFRRCTSLSSINISPRVTYVGDNAFKETAWYNNQENGLVYIHKILYKYKGNMPTNTNIVIPEGIISISPDAFKDCENLTSITIPSTVKNIGNGAFLFCRSLKNVTIPNGVKELSTYMFNQCSSLSSICLPESIETIGYDVFYHVESLKEIIIPKGQKARFLQMGLQKYEHLLVERDNEEITILLNLAKAYEKGIGVAQNIPQSILYYIQAAEKGSAEAAYQLAEWYAKGENLTKDARKALQYYQQAAKISYRDAHLKAEQLQREIEAEQQRYNDQMAEFMNEQVMSYAQQTISEEVQPTYLLFDTECNGLPQFYDMDVRMTNNWPNVIQLAWIVADEQGNILKRKSHIITPEGFEINDNVAALTGITTSRAMREGIELTTALSDFMSDVNNAQLLIGHNIDFDMKVVGCELYRNGMDYESLLSKKTLCTMKRSTYFCAIPNPRGKFNDYKWPKLEELYRKLFNRPLTNAHDALADITATKECYFELRRLGVI